MISGLLESRRNAPRRRGGMVVSVALHSAAIGLAVVATGRASLTVATPEPPDVLVWVSPAPSPVHTAAPTTSATSAARTAATTAAMPSVDIPTIPDVATIATGIPPVDVGRPALDADALRQLRVRGSSGGGARPGGGEGWGEAFTANHVDRPVLALPGSATPRYPDVLRSAGVSGRVVARFVVDTAGRVEAGSLRVLSATHAQFTAAVEAALPRMRFRPAEAGGHKVRQLVEQPFEFEVR